jgi:hypothetical protein
MSSSDKTISIDPEMFKINSKINQRKTKKEQSNSKIKFKHPVNKTIKYNKILQFIRNKQNANYNQLLNENPTPIKTTDVNYMLPPKGEFEESLNFLNEIRENNAKPDNNEIQPRQSLANSNIPHYTVKNHSYHPEHTVPVNIPLNMTTLTDANNNIYVNQPTHPLKIAPRPNYGILKGGSLPTYRQYIKTLSNRNLTRPPSSPLPSPSPSPPPDYSTLSPMISDNSIRNDIYHHANMVNILNKEETERKDQQKQLQNKINKNSSKRKKTIRKTFRLGRSKYYSQIGVIINNKTIRNECSTKKHLLKQTPISEVKTFLIKKGFIKVGSVAPNDVLRKMYESANMICGDVQNHNTEILLHNYIHS